MVFLHSGCSGSGFLHGCDTAAVPIIWRARPVCRGVERTQKEAADALGISQSYISRLEKRIIHTLKAQLESE